MAVDEERKPTYLVYNAQHLMRTRVAPEKAQLRASDCSHVPHVLAKAFFEELI